MSCLEVFVSEVRPGDVVLGPSGKGFVRAVASDGYLVVVEMMDGATWDARHYHKVCRCSVRSGDEFTVRARGLVTSWSSGDHGRLFGVFGEAVAGIEALRAVARSSGRVASSGSALVRIT